MAQDLLEVGAKWLTGKLKDHASRAVLYQRGDEQVSLQATIGRTLLKLDDGSGGVRMEWTDRDFLIPAADLVLGGSVTLPRRGDRIREMAGDGELVYEVLAPGGEPPWRWSDHHRQRLRIHTKQIAGGAGGGGGSSSGSSGLGSGGLSSGSD